MNKFFFYVAVFTSIFVVAVIALVGIGAGSVDGFLVYFAITMSAGVILHFLAWKKPDVKILKLLAGVLYLLGVFTVISAIICFVYSGKKKKVDETEIVPETIK